MSPALPVLIDSDVLIWLTRGHVGAAQRLGQISNWRISAVTYMELAQGCRDRAELVDLLALSHGMRLADALIGATAIKHSATLITANTRHFGAIEAFLP